MEHPNERTVAKLEYEKRIHKNTLFIETQLRI